WQEPCHYIIWLPKYHRRMIRWPKYKFDLSQWLILLKFAPRECFTKNYKIIKKVLKILLLVVVAVLFLLGSILLLIQLPVVQTYLTQKIAAKLSKELNTTVSIEAVDIDFFNSLVLEGLYMEDLQGDTLIYAQSFVAQISNFDLENKYLRISELALST